MVGLLACLWLSRNADLKTIMKKCDDLYLRLSEMANPVIHLRVLRLGEYNSLFLFGDAR